MAKSCNQYYFNANRFYFYIAGIISFTIVGIAAAKIFTAADPNLYIGLLTTVLSFWSQPPKLVEPESQKQDDESLRIG